jgi:Mce-associated membrane protein
VDSGQEIPRRSLRLPIALGLLALLVAGVAVWFGIESSRLSGDADRLRAEAATVAARAGTLTGAGRTGEVVGALRPVIEQVLSYDHRNPDTPAVKAHLAGKASCQHDQLFGEVKRVGPAQRLVLTSRVREIGLTRLDGDRVQLLVFVDQTTMRGEQTSSGGSQLGLAAQRQAGTWKITQFDLLGPSAPAC